MASSVNSTYALTTSGNWQVPLGVSSITVECFGSVAALTGEVSTFQTARSGASYSKSTTIAVTAGQTFYYNIGAAGGVTWFNTANSQPVVGVNTPTTSCLAVGGNITSTSQVAANIGDVKYAGGAGRVSTGSAVSGAGGNAGPNGAGAAAGAPYSNTADSQGTLIGCGGGANGGSQGGLGVIPYGRLGSGATAGAGNGRYWSGSAYIDQTKDLTSSSDYLANAPQFVTTNYGAIGGSAPAYFSYCCFGCQVSGYSASGNAGFIIITLNSPTQLSIVNNGTSNFVVPANFGSLVSIESQARGGNTSSGNAGGGGGGAYSKTNVASITSSIVAGSTVVYYANSATDSWLRIATNSSPSSVADGVLAKAGSLGGSVAGGDGGLASAGIGDVKFSGGNGGSGFSTNTYTKGGGGGGAGPDSAGGDGGAGYTGAANKGSGGGGAANNTAVGNAGTSTAGGAGANGLGTGGAGGTSILNGRAGTNGGGGGGGFGASFNNGGAGGQLLINGIYYILAGEGGNASSPGGWGGGASNYAGYAIFTYSPVAAGGANTSNFFQFF
jgi:hypothetical protein